MNETVERSRILGMRLQTGIVLYFAGCFAMIMIMYLVRLAQVGDHYEMTHHMYDPKDVIPFGSNGWNPFVYLYVAASLTVMFGYPVAGLVALAGVSQLFSRRMRQFPLNWRLLLVGSICSLALAVVSFTTFGADLRLWLLD